MGGITGSLTGSKGRSSGTSYTRPFVTNTGFSSLNTATGQLTFDPTIRALQDQALGGFGDLTNQLGGGLSNYLTSTQALRDQLSGISGTLRQARIAPYQQAAAQSLGQVQRDVGLRGLGGSSFGQGAISNQQFENARQIGQASALADADTIAAQTGLDKDMLNAIIGKVTLEAQLNGQSIEVARQRLAQELAAFGLGTTQTGAQTTTGTSWGIGGSLGLGGTLGTGGGSAA